MKTPFLAAAAALLAVCISTSAHAISFTATLSGDLINGQAPASDPLGLANLTSWSFEIEMERPVVPTTLAELFPLFDATGDFGRFSLFDSNGLVAQRMLEVNGANIIPETYINDGILVHNSPIVTNWAWNATVLGDRMGLLYLAPNGDENDWFAYTGTNMTLNVSNSPVPDSGTTAALAGFGLFSLLVIRRKLVAR